MLVASFREAQLRFPKNDAAVETPRHRRNSIRALPDSSVPAMHALFGFEECRGHVRQ